jgi:hypothetical protein
VHPSRITSGGRQLPTVSPVIAPSTANATLVNSSVMPERTTSVDPICALLS